MTPDRLRPRIWHTDWMILRQLARVIGHDVAGALKPRDVVVDFGCGQMPYREVIEAKGVVYKGADLGPDAELQIGADGRVQAEDHSCDAVLSVQVLEHVRDLDAYCAEIRRLLRSDGTLFLSTHGTWLYHAHPEDHRRWTRTGLICDLEQRGFAVETIDALVGPLATTTLLRLTGYAYVMRKLPVVGPLLAGTLSVIMNLRAMLEDRITPAHIRMDNACVYWLKARLAG
ncbi:MAG: methyltransferase domain-containing protein [Novosphingobium sp.]|jgi:SAM-dependent methyltransferase|uniref:methyltransferase domain-containing protein n=1 Tax=Novosphingobium sp. TaxID=1874826 RepID=UPI0030174DC9